MSSDARTLLLAAPVGRTELPADEALDDINAALNYAGSKAESLKLSKPDIVVISDGYDSMSNETRDEFNKFRLRSGGRLFAIFTGVSRQTAESSPLAKLADKFWCEDDILKSLIEVGESVS